MPKFFNSDLADLAHQLTLSPRRLRVAQIWGVERMLSMVDPQRAYPYELVCYTVTGYRKRGTVDAGPLIPGKALVNDLVSLAEVLSRKAGMSPAELGEACQTQEELSRTLHVSTKTLRRWRARGLMGVRLLFADGVSRLAFCKRTVDRFTAQHSALVAKGTAFSQLSAGERKCMVDRARALTTQEPIKLHAVARQIAEETGRAVETVRYTLRRHDQLHPDAAVFRRDGTPAGCSRHEAMWRCHRSGEPATAIARAFACSVDEVERVLRAVRVRTWQQSPPPFVYNDLFAAPDADRLILEVPEPAASDAALARPPASVPAYLRSLYRTPLLSREQEYDLFRRYNYLKFKAHRLIQALRPAEAGADACRQVEEWLARAEEVKQRIIRANLRLVVSVAKRHVGTSSNFFEVVSDGNVSLMRAVERFDFSLGNKFSTYATWAIMKNFARSIPEQHYHYARYVTGQELALETAADPTPAPASDSDRRKVREIIARGLTELTQREREIVRGHFGLFGDGVPQTLEQLGERFGVTKERVRQIELRALARLREVLSPSLVEALAE